MDQHTQEMNERRTHRSRRELLKLQLLYKMKESRKGFLTPAALFHFLHNKNKLKANRQ